MAESNLICNGNTLFFEVLEHDFHLRFRAIVYAVYMPGSVQEFDNNGTTVVEVYFSDIVFGQPGCEFFHKTIQAAGLHIDTSFRVFFSCSCRRDCWFKTYNGILFFLAIEIGDFKQKQGRWTNQTPLFS